MSDPTVLQVIAAAIESANIDFPDSPDGTTWERIYRSTEECNHLARAVVSGLEKWATQLFLPRDRQIDRALVKL